MIARHTPRLASFFEGKRSCPCAYAVWSHSDLCAAETRTERPRPALHGENTSLAVCNRAASRSYPRLVHQRRWGGYGLRRGDGRAVAPAPGSGDANGRGLRVGHRGAVASGAGRQRIRSHHPLCGCFDLGGTRAEVTVHQARRRDGPVGYGAGKGGGRVPLYKMPRRQGARRGADQYGVGAIRRGKARQLTENSELWRACAVSRSRWA